MQQTSHQQGKIKGPAGGTWVPPDQRTPHWLIFHEKFSCRVSYINSLSVEEIDFFGMPSSGHKRYDQEMANEMQLRMLTINEMVEFYRKGVPIVLSNNVDPKQVYDIIEDFLMEWRSILERTMNRASAPVEELILMDSFANLIYDKGQFKFTEEIVDSILSKAMSATMKFSRDSILTPRKKDASTTIGDDMKAPVKKEEPKRNSMAQTFAEYQPNRARLPSWK